MFAFLRNFLRNFQDPERLKDLEDFYLLKDLGVIVVPPDYEHSTVLARLRSKAKEGSEFY